MYQLQERFRRSLTFESGPLLVHGLSENVVVDKSQTIWDKQDDDGEEQQRKRKVDAINQRFPVTLEECFSQLCHDSDIPVFAFDTPSPDDSVRLRMQQKREKLFHQRQQQAEKQKQQRIKRQEQELRRLEKKNKPIQKSKRQLEREEKEEKKRLQKEQQRRNQEQSRLKKHLPSRAQNVQIVDSPL